MEALLQLVDDVRSIKIMLREMRDRDRAMKNAATDTESSK